MQMWKKCLAEFIGTATLVLLGCGAAVVIGAMAGDVTSAARVVGISLAFGLSIVATAYIVGKVSGCHINPAVSLGVLIAGKMSFVEFIAYVISQIAGAFAGAGILIGIISSSGVISFPATGLGQNGFGPGYGLELSAGGAFLVEVVLTFVFVFVILGVTSSEKTASVAGIVIGLTLVLVHIIGINLTGTSVNPARSLAPAFLVGGTALSQVWVFVTAPFVGALLAGIVFRIFGVDRADENERAA